MKENFRNKVFGFILMIALLMSIGYSAPAPPVLVSGMIVDYNVPNINVQIKDTTSGLIINTVTNHFGEFQYDLNAHNNWACGDAIQIMILGKVEYGKIECTSNGVGLGYKDNSGLAYAKFDFSSSCPPCSCQRCDSCCPTCSGGGGGGSVIIINCSEEKCLDLFPCDITACEECPECLECETCVECPNCDDYCEVCEICEVCPVCNDGLLGTIVAVILSLIAGAGIGLSVYKDKSGKLKFSIRSHRHTGRNYLHSIYRVHRKPYTHEHGEVMPVYKFNALERTWSYVPKGD